MKAVFDQRIEICARLPLQSELNMLKNIGSTARDHLANERTFLSWARTGLGFVGAGTGLFTAYALGNRSSTLGPRDVLPASTLLVTNGGALLGFAVYRFLEVQRALADGHFPVGKKGVLVMVGATALSTCVAMGYIGFIEFWQLDHSHSA